MPPMQRRSRMLPPAADLVGSVSTSSTHLVLLHCQGEEEDLLQALDLALQRQNNGTAQP